MAHIPACVVYYQLIVCSSRSLAGPLSLPRTYEATLVLHTALRVRRATLRHGHPGRRARVEQGRPAPLASHALWIARGAGGARVARGGRRGGPSRRHLGTRALL